jgi:Cu(I)/Ag(I) efflux system protein CusF
MQYFKHLAIVVAIASIGGVPVFANASGDHGAHKTVAAQASDMTEGEVRKVDTEAGKITLKHSEIKSLEMPAMTMVFNVRDKAMLDKVKSGDKVKFKAVNEAGKFTVTELQVLR